MTSTNIDTGLLVFEVPALFLLAYIFTIFFAFQGVAIFVIFVPLSKQVREAYSKWWRVKVAESEILSSYFSDWSFRNNSSSVSSHNHVLVNQSFYTAKLRVTVVIRFHAHFVCLIHANNNYYSNSVLQVNNGKTPSKNQRSSSNIYELESNIPKVAFELSVSLDTEGTKTPDITAPDYGFTFNITMIYPQGKSGELKL